MPNKLKKYTAEFFGTFLLMVMGGGAIAVDSQTGGLGPIGISLVFGLTVLVVIYSIGHISGAHINPAVTLGFIAAKRMKPFEAFPYILAQVAGASFGMLIVSLLIPSGPGGNAMTLPAIPPSQALLLEFVMTFILMFVIEGVAHDNRAEGVMAGVAIGAIVACVAMVAGPVTGGSINPARSFGPAFLSMNFQYQWIYWIAPILGAVSGALFYESIRCPNTGEKSGQGCC